MTEEQDKEFFEKLAGYAEEAKQDYEIKFAKHSSVANKNQTNQTLYSELEENEEEGQLAIDVYQTPDDIVIESAIAGVEPDDLDINVSNDSITIKGRRRRLHEPEPRTYLCQECFWGKFSRSVILPQEIDPDKATVHFKNGVLKIRLPKLNRKKVKKLKIKTE